MDVSQGEDDGLLSPLCGSRDGVVAGERMIDDALEAEDAEVAPAGGEVGVGDLAYAGEGHRAIIRSGLTEIGLAASEV